MCSLGSKLCVFENIAKVVLTLTYWTSNASTSLTVRAGVNRFWQQKSSLIRSSDNKIGQKNGNEKIG